jgi:N-acetylated-alpha-linked acidic dipeptidase
MLSVPSEDHAREWLKYYTSKPHIAGSDNDYEQALWTRDKFTEFGLPDVWLNTYYPLLNYPKARNVSVQQSDGTVRYLKLQEDPVAEDESTVKYTNAIPPFHGYSYSGSATGQIVYANYGTREDFDILKANGIDVEGMLVLVRYGRNFRGLKVRAAELAGCIGILIYSDPDDDGYGKGAVYPEGPYRPASGVQRGSVHYMSLYPGDPLTPGVPAHENAERIPIEDAVTLPKIPSLPISYQDAQIIFESLKGTGINCKTLDNGSWVGGLDENLYFTGPSNHNVTMVNDVEYKTAPVWNVLAKINGTMYPDEYIVLGNHRDAWVFGAMDPSSGSASFVELARSLGHMLKKGWKPLRSIILASWDGEEYGMLGSTEYVEDFVQDLKKNAVAYVNVDNSASGSEFSVSSTPSLSSVIREITKKVNDPKSGRTVYDEWMKADMEWNSKHNTSGEEFRAHPVVSELGSGSDFVAFCDYAGVPSVSFAFKGPYGVYHSIYDSFNWMQKFGDPGCKYEVTATKLWGLLSLTLSDSIILPLNYTEYAVELDFYVNKLEKALNEGLDKQIPRSNLTVLRDSIKPLYEVSKAIEKKMEYLKQQVSRKSFSLVKYLSTKENFELNQEIALINKKLYLAERQFLLPTGGIEGREWYKHVIYAPGLWAGYGAVTFPTLTESIEEYIKSGRKEKNLNRVMKAQQEVSERVQAVVKFLDISEQEQ